MKRKNFTYACPYYISNPEKYSKCASHDIVGLHRLRQHITRTHMNWCDRCKQSFHTARDLEKHTENGSCHPQVQYPVGYVNRNILDEGLKAGARANEQEKYGHLYQVLFHCDLPTNAYVKFYGPLHGEAYGQAMLHTLLYCIADKITNTPMPQFLPPRETKQLFISTIQDTVNGLMSPNETQRQDLSRLAMMIIQDGLGPMSPPSFFVPEPFALPVETELSPTGTTLPGSSIANPTWVLQGEQSGIPAYQQAQNVSFGQQGPADAQWSTEAAYLDPTTYVDVPPGIIESTAPTSLDITFDDYANVNGVGNYGEYPTHTEYYGHASVDTQ
ncbi:Sal-like protein 3 [Ceratocystis lukuohia]|uniref:Sal-like protein 3 n=1 Tax=Ceratocystis lukuohia TaxID=2019550 RepID=A0ABR4MDX5_9PEZI